MNQILAMESLTIAKIQEMFEREKMRKIRNQEAHKRWVQKHKEAGTYSTVRQKYNTDYTVKKKNRKAAEEWMVMIIFSRFFNRGWKIERYLRKYFLRYI